jgi:endonuclease/exonuclease/phosphatase family metal-dependent hydrolase
VLVATANIHAGVDGYGRRTEVVSELLELHADLLFVQELWRGDAEDQFSMVKETLRLHGEFVELSPCVRVTGEVGGRGWHPIHGLLSGDRGLYFDTHTELSESRVSRRDAARGTESGSWGVALFTTLPIHNIQVEYLPQLRRDKTRRALIIATCEYEGRLFTAVAIHGAHISHGSLKQYRFVARRLHELSLSNPVVTAGDFNCWRPLLRTVLPGWRSAVRARTWPAWRPHSQIDHILLRGPWAVRKGRSIRNGSDHRALSVELTWR